MIVVGDDATKDKYEAPCPCIHLGPFAGPDLPARYLNPQLKPEVPLKSATDPQPSTEALAPAPNCLQ